MYSNTTTIIERGMQCLVETLGEVETEEFLSTIMREHFDYTKWQRVHFDDVTSSEFNTAAINYAKVHKWS